MNRKGKWSNYVTKHSFALSLEPGVFTWNDPKAIALSLKKSAEESTNRKAPPFQSAMSMLNFYINRAGKNLKPQRKAVLNQAKEELRKLFPKGFLNIALILLILVLLAGLGFGIFSLIKSNQKSTAPFQKSESSSSQSFYNWPMLGRDSSHSGFSQGLAPNDNSVFLKITSINNSNSPEDLQGLVFQDNRLYLAAGNSVSAINALSGDKIWETSLKGLFDFNSDEETIKGLAATSEKLFVSRKNELLALDIKTGKKLWQFTAKDTITAPTISGEKIFFGSDDDYLYALDFNGQLAWRFQTQGNIHSVPAVKDNQVCFGAENPDFSVYCLNKQSGEIIWRHQFAKSQRDLGGMFHAPPVITDNLVLIGEEGGNRGIRKSGAKTSPSPSNFYALDIKTGETVWRFEASDWIVTSAATANNKVFFSAWDASFYALDLTSGKLLWQATSGSHALWQARGGWEPLIADHKVFVGSPYDPAYSSDKSILAYNTENGELIWKYQAEDIPKFLILGDGRLYAGFTSEEPLHFQIMGFSSKKTP